jgi:hypothetical protein
VIWAVPPGVPKDLPTQTSAAWVDKEVQVWLESDASDMGPVFVRKWLGLPDAAKLQGDYRISGPWPLLPELNMTTLVSPDVRSSPFTEPAFLSQFPSISSRGTVMSRALFGQLVPPPPPEISTQPPETDLSERIALENAIATPACLACHRLFDPLGYALSHYDGSGAYRELDKGQAIDTSGSVGLPADDRTLDFQDLPDLLSSSWATCSARLSIADNFLRIALELSGFSEQQRDQLFTANQARIEEAFVNSSLSYWSLVTAYAQTPAVLQP